MLLASIACAPCPKRVATLRFSLSFSCLGLQAVALGAAVQAGILEGQVSDVMVLDVWQASLMRAFAKQRLRQDQQLAAEAGQDPDQLQDSSDDEVSRHVTCIVDESLQSCFSCSSETAVKV